MLRALELEDMELIRRWRNDSLDTLRTPFPLTKEQQEAWYRDEICNRSSRSRFWAVLDNTGVLVGYGGIENIQWENSIGEISLLINPEKRGQGLGAMAAMEILDEAMDRLNLHTVYAECYTNNPATKFWDEIFGSSNRVTLKDRKYCDGSYFDSYYYSMSMDI